jgi:hypothetical protein
VLAADTALYSTGIIHHRHLHARRALLQWSILVRCAPLRVCLLLSNEECVPFDCNHFLRLIVIERPQRVCSVPGAGLLLSVCLFGNRSRRRFIEQKGLGVIEKVMNTSDACNACFETAF